MADAQQFVVSVKGLTKAVDRRATRRIVGRLD
ncbi:hypothetical protein ABIA23_004856 [Sinorhizobium fredii]